MELVFMVAGTTTISLAMKKVSVIDYYNTLADKYDDMYTDKVSMCENDVFFDWLSRRRSEGRVLDAGCGTGIVLDYVVPTIVPGDYIGFDVSANMLMKAREKHPDYATRFIRHDMMSERIGWTSSFENVWCLFGVLTCLPSSYIPDAIAILTSYVKDGGSLVLVPNGTRDPRERESSCHGKEKGFQSDFTLLPFGSWKLILGAMGYDFSIMAFNTEGDELEDEDLISESLTKDLESEVEKDTECSFFVIEIRK